MLFLQLWAGPRTWGELRYAATGLLIALSGFVYVAAMVCVGSVLSVVVIGLPVLVAGIEGARWFGEVERRRARRLLGVQVETPSKRSAGAGFFRWLHRGLMDPGGWLAVLHVVLKVPVACIGLCAVALFWVVGAAEVSYPLWMHVGDLTQVWGGAAMDTLPRSFAVAGVGLVLLACAPWAVRGSLTLDRFLLRTMLGPTRTSERVRHLEETRSLAVDHSAVILRKIERDLHDGAQARMVAVTMDLGTAKQVLANGDPHLDLAKELVDLAHRNATAAITELRDLARGIHPPALDRSLDTALATLANHSRVPVDLHVRLPDRPSRAIETIIYFCASELLTNIVKHSRASRASIDVSQDRHALCLRVSDDGIGGAAVGTNGGLAGLHERLAPVDGQLTITSPPGGPTLITVEIPNHT